MLADTPISHESSVTVGLGWMVAVGIATAWAALLAHVHKTFVRKDVLAETLARRDAQLAALKEQIDAAKAEIKDEIKSAMRSVHGGRDD